MDGTDARWVADARLGQAQAFRRLVEVHARPLFHVCVRITRDEALAEDAVQEAFYKAWRGLPEFDGRAAFGTWLHRIAVNSALEQLRRNARHRHEASGSEDDGEHDDALLERQGDDAPGPESHATGSEIERCIDRQLARMSALERAAFVMRHYQGEPLEAIAATLSINIGQSKQAVFRAVRKLRAALEPWRDA